MTRKWLFSGIAFAVVLSLSAQVQGPDINPGMWEFTTVTEMVGMPNMNIPPVTYTQCVTMENLVPQSDAASQECEMSDVAVDGSTVSWKIICAGQNGRMEGTGKVTYTGDTMEGTMDLVIADAGMQVKNTIKGKRIGDCQGTER
jgi:hypothetical protein